MAAKKRFDSEGLASPEYRRFIEELKARVTSARISAARAVNRELISLYWDIGRAIAEKQQVLGWGDAVVEKISADLQRAFPRMTGFSPRNVWDMRRLYETYTAPDSLAQAQHGIARGSSGLILRQPVAELNPDRREPPVVAKSLSRSKTNDSKVRQQASAKREEAGSFLQQLVAEIPWGHNLLILNKLTTPISRLWYLRATSQFGWTRNVLLNQIKADAS